MEIQPLRDRRPLAVQVYDRLYDTLMRPGETLVVLPTEQELAQQLAVSRTTVRQALALLEEDGVIERGPGRRRQVTHRSPAEVGAVLPMEEMIQTPQAITVERIVRRVSPATGWSAPLLELERGQEIATWESLIRVGSKTVASTLEVIEASHEPDTTESGTMFALLGPHYRRKAQLSSLRLSPLMASTRKWPKPTQVPIPLTLTFTTRAPNGPLYLAKHVVDISEVSLNALVDTHGQIAESIP